MSTQAIQRLGIPKIAVTDGPNGARGPHLPGAGGPKSSCIPCGSAIGATWNVLLADELGALVGREALDRGCRGLLAPTVNLHRSPLAGRNFECYSEDPLLSGRLAAAYVRGVQSNGVFATVKHFVGNDAEFERGSISSVIDERALRELYLVPFELAVGEGGALGIMTSYNRVNGRWLTEQREFLIDILREEWGFEGLVMTDWFAMVDTVTSLGAGLDLEMPGPGRALGSALATRIADGDDALKQDVDQSVRRLLSGLDRIGALDGPTPAPAPKPPSGEDRELLRTAAVDATVLLRNDGTLPLTPAELKRVAVLGDHAVSPRIQGGGSCQVAQYRAASPLEMLTATLGKNVDLVFERGCEVDRSGTVIGRSVLRAPAGFETTVYEGPDWIGEPVSRGHVDDLRLFVLSSEAQGYPSGNWSLRVRGTVLPEEDGLFQLGLAQSGSARLFIDGELVLDGFENPPPPGGHDFFGAASQDLVADVYLSKGRPAEFLVEYARTGAGFAGVRVGYRTTDADALLERAVAAAEAAQVALVFVGTTDEWETEGRDRSFFHLPGRQDELIRRVAAVNERTVVVVNAGAPVDLPWEEDVAAILQCWFGGDEMGAAVAAILTGEREPGGRLPTSVPARLEHTPSYDNFPGENGEIRYGESVFMGYRGYEHRCIAPRFPFGHGLSYTAFEFGVPTLSAETFRPGDTITVSVPIRNIGERPGTEVVQCYVAPESPRLARPPKELKAFAKIWLEPGESAVVVLQLDDRSFACWDPGQPDWEDVAKRAGASTHSNVQIRGVRGWRIDPGGYRLLIGRSSTETLISSRVEILAAGKAG
jgi:beta-glucosidase